MRQIHRLDAESPLPHLFVLLFVLAAIIVDHVQGRECAKLDDALDTSLERTSSLTRLMPRLSPKPRRYAGPSCAGNEKAARTDDRQQGIRLNFT